jgi:hypothetical protein
VWCHVELMAARWKMGADTWAQSWWKEADRWAPRGSGFSNK